MAQADVGSLVEGGEVQRGEGGTAHCSVVLGTASNTAVRQGMSEGVQRDHTLQRHRYSCRGAALQAAIGGKLTDRVQLAQSNSKQVSQWVASPPVLYPVHPTPFYFPFSRSRQLASRPGQAGDTGR